MDAPVPAPDTKKINRTVVIVLVVAAALLLVCLLIAGSGWFLLRDQLDTLLAGPVLPAPTESLAPTEVPAPASAYLLTQDNSMGDPNAPVKIVEYSDFQCPYCRRFALQTFPAIMNNYIETGQVYFTYRSVGAFLGPESAEAAQAAYCAGDQGLFWDYSDRIWAAQVGENVGAYTRENMLRMGEDLGLDMEDFRACLTSGKYAARVEQDVNDAIAAGVTGTPSFVINGQLAIEGAYPFEAFQQAIDPLLGGK